MQTVAKNIGITTEARVMCELSAILEAEIAWPEVAGSRSDEEQRQQDRLFERRQVLEAKLLGMEPITRAGKLTRTLIGLSRADEYLGNGDRDDGAPEGVGVGVWQFMHEAAADLSGEGARVVELALEWYALPPARLRPAEVAQGLRRALGTRRLRRSRPGTRQVCSPAA